MVESNQTAIDHYILTTVRLEAEGFFEIYKKLRIEMKEMLPAIFGGSRDLSIQGPTTVCLMLALELYLRELHLVLGIKTEGAQNILTLVEGLPEDMQHNILNSDLLAAMGGYKKKNIEVLKEISNSFYKWRYAKEYISCETLAYKNHYPFGFAEELIEIIKSIIKETLEIESQKFPT